MRLVFPGPLSRRLRTSRSMVSTGHSLILRSALAYSSWCRCVCRKSTAAPIVSICTSVNCSRAGREREYQELREHFKDEEIVELTWDVAVINAWNRMAIGMHQPVDTKPID